MKIAFIDLAQQQARIRDKIDTGLTNVLDHGAYIMGPEVGALENRLGSWTKATHNISCSSGTDALLLALHGLKLRPGQGVIVPSFILKSRLIVSTLIQTNLKPHSQPEKRLILMLLGLLVLGCLASQPIMMRFAHLQTFIICGLSTMRLRALAHVGGAVQLASLPM